MPEMAKVANSTLTDRRATVAVCPEAMRMAVFGYSLSMLPGP